MKKFVLVAIYTLYAGMICASPFKVDGETIYYDTVNTEGVDGVDFGHDEELLKLLKQNTSVKKIVLNSTGGFIPPSKKMSALVIDANLDTHVEFECSSSCVTIFLGGKNRTLALGARLGFHKSYWEADSIEAYYNKGKEEGDWENHFEFASWLYEDTQAEVFEDFEYLLERGVSPRFAIETLKAGADGMWHPRRQKLLESGLLTE